MIFDKYSKKAQVTIFAIIAILIVAAVGIFAYLQTKPQILASEFRPIEQYFLECIKNKAQEGARILGEQGGYIQLPKFERGSEYMPFSSQLDFFGNAVQYWFYISGNNIMRQQVPSLQGMEKQLSDFLKEEIENCDFSQFEDAGYAIEMGEANILTKIRDNSVDVKVVGSLSINRGDMSATVPFHEVSTESKLGKFYRIAKSIYDKQQKELFLENYSIDILRLYAPVDNVKLSCAPQVWLKEQVAIDLKEAIQANIGALKVAGNYYKLANADSKYFVVDTGTKSDENINFLYNPSWPTRLEVWPNNNGVMTAEPVGMQKGLGILGFCYVQYHFVYDMAYPVLVQIFDAKEMFQFPVIVSISKNMPREGFKTEAVEGVKTEVCKNKLTDVRTTTVDSSLNPIEAGITFKCFDESCDIGKTKISDGEAVLDEKMPQCIGGTIVASAEGYAESKIQLDTNEPATAELILQPLYELSVDLYIGGVPIARDEQALITFTSQDDSISISYPQQKSVRLREGYYNISVSAYRQGSIAIGSHKTQKCVKVPVKGLGAFFGMTREQCYDIELPAQTLTQIISGGGNAAEYFTEDVLRAAKRIEIMASVLPLPKDITDLQTAYALLDASEVSIFLS